MIENLLERISRDTDVNGVLPALSLEGKGQMVYSIDIFQTAFLALCLSRLSYLVNSVFPMSSRGSIPSKEHISRIIKRIQEEIEAVKLDGRLTLLVLREIGKVLLLLAERAEYQISTGPEARQITGPATPAQLKNFALCQHLQEVHTRVSSMIKGLPTIAADVLSPSLGAIYGVACDSVTSLFQAMLDRLESCILHFHDKTLVCLAWMLQWTTMHHLTWRSCRSAFFTSEVNFYQDCCLLQQILSPREQKQYAQGLLGALPLGF